MNLKELNNRYEKIIHSNLPDEIKTNQLTMLMTYMEGAFSIPMLMERTAEWERNNKKILTLYEKIASSRNFS